MCRFKAYDRPRIGVGGRVEHVAQFVHHSAVGAVEHRFLEFLYHDRALHFEHLRVERQGEHAVALGAQRGLDVLRRHQVGARTHIVHHIYGCHGSACVVAVYDTQAVVKREADGFAHSAGRRFQACGYSTIFILRMRTSWRGRSCGPVGTFSMLSTTFIPLTTSPNTVYWPSRCGVPPTVL